MLARGGQPGHDPTLVVARRGGRRPGRAAGLAGHRACGWPRPVAAAARAVAAGGADAFLALLGSGEPMIPAWEDLDQAGLISTLLPGWERLRSMPQRDPIHLYTVDRHLMQTAVEAPGSRPPGVPARPAAAGRDPARHRQGAFRRVPEPLGGRRRRSSGRGCGGWVCRPAGHRRDHHPDPAPPAARRTPPRERDPDDPATIAALVDADPATLPTLDLLHALTDRRRHAPPARPRGRTWKAGQVSHLVSRVRRALAGEPPAEPPAITEVERELIEAGGVGIVIEQVPGALRVTIAAPDRPGLLAASAAVLTMHRLTVRTAAARTVEPHRAADLDGGSAVRRRRPPRPPCGPTWCGRWTAASTWRRGWPGAARRRGAGRRRRRRSG